MSSEKQVGLPEWYLLKHAADEATVMSEDYEWPVGELLTLPPFYVSRKFIAAASPENILKLIADLAYWKAEAQRLSDRVDELLVKETESIEALARVREECEKAKSLLRGSFEEAFDDDVNAWQESVIDFLREPTETKFWSTGGEVDE